MFSSSTPSPWRGVRAFSSSSLSSDQEVEWKELTQEQPLGCSASEGEGGEDVYREHLLEVQQEKQSRFIPVKAYFLSTSIDLRGLQNQNAFNVIPPSSRATNYIVLRYYDVKVEHTVSPIFLPQLHFVKVFVFLFNWSLCSWVN
ncbi:hypothetical protein QJS04_geneDACA016184 [Acorus gramineus]|uniref:Uncharacterized protein n=1 Tax=Acorus gramineus TaxID=55184 RepID=A0AAV9B1Z6_ACOGR|nr:hypothetical protein QJS04_geneDACA016184 [Acorus gramineus]